MHSLAFGVELAPLRVQRPVAVRKPPHRSSAIGWLAAICPQPVQVALYSLVRGW